MRRLSLVFLVVLLAAACGKSPVGPTPPPPPPVQHSYHDPEIFFHFENSAFYPRTAASTDTAVMRWYQVGPPPDYARTLLAQVAMGGTDSLCVYFFADSVPLVVSNVWRWRGVESGAHESSMTPGASDYLPFWDLVTGEDTVSSSITSSADSRASPTFCPAGMRRDSIHP